MSLPALYHKRRPSEQKKLRAGCRFQASFHARGVLVRIAKAAGTAEFGGTMRARLSIVAVALLALAAGCEKKIGSDPAAEQACLEEGYDAGTTEYAECVKELSGSD